MKKTPQHYLAEAREELHITMPMMEHSTSAIKAVAAKALELQAADLAKDSICKDYLPNSKMKNIPKKIYLQIDADGETPEDFNGLSGISWCSERIHANDLEYISKEEHEREMEEQREFYEWLGEGGDWEFVGDGWWSNGKTNEDATTEQLWETWKK